MTTNAPRTVVLPGDGVGPKATADAILFGATGRSDLDAPRAALNVG